MTFRDTFRDYLVSLHGIKLYAGGNPTTLDDNLVDSMDHS